MDIFPKENIVRNIAWILDCRSIQNADVGARLPKNVVDVLYGRYPDRKHCGGVNAVAPPGANLIKQATQRAIYYSTSEWCLARRKDSLCRRKARNGVRQIYALACCFCFSCLENSMHKSLTTSYGSRISTLKWECYKLPLRI